MNNSCFSHTSSTTAAFVLTVFFVLVETGISFAGDSAIPNSAKATVLLITGDKIADAWKNARWKKIDACVVTASKPIIAWNKKKEEEERKRQAELARIAQIEADRLAAEAAEHADAGINDTADDLLDAAVEQEDKSAALNAKATGDIKTRSAGMYSTASSRKVWVFKIDNYPALDVAALAIYFTEDALDKAIRSAIKDGIREIKGVKIYQEDKITIR